MLCALGCSQALTGGAWAPIWRKFVPKWAEHPHLGSRLPPPQLGGLWVGVGAFAAPGSGPARSDPSPGVQENTYQHVFCSICRALRGPRTHLHLCRGSRCQREKRKNLKSRAWGHGSPLAGEARELEQPWLGQEGRKITFSPLLLIAGSFLLSASPLSWVFGRHCCGECSFPPPLSSRERVQELGAELPKPPLDRVHRGQQGGPTCRGDTGLCPTPLGTPVAPTDVL